MSDLESETRPSSGLPSAEAIEQGLRATVAKIYKSGNLDELTVTRVRLATEKILGLEQGVLKAHAEWKQKSDEIIKDEVVCTLSNSSVLKRKSACVYIPKYVCASIKIGV